MNDIFDWFAKQKVSDRWQIVTILCVIGAMPMEIMVLACIIFTLLAWYYESKEKLPKGGSE